MSDMVPRPPPIGRGTMESLVVFAKAPFAGTVKTRLAKERGDAVAARLYTAFLEDTAVACAAWRKETIGTDPNRRLLLYCAPDIQDPILSEISRRSGARAVAQPDGDLGARLSHIFAEEFDRGARAVCAIGSDSPTLPAHLINYAFRALRWHRVVLGPTFDGGYWLVGAQRPAPDLFSDIPWSTAGVLAKTLGQLSHQGVNAFLLPFWYDIDEAADLERLVWHVRAQRALHQNCAPATWAALQEIGLVRAER